MQNVEKAWRPAQLTPESAASFDDPDVVACYGQRPRYAEGTLATLARLAGGATGRVLDVGTGLGELTRRLAPRVAEVTALDLSPRMIERARTLAGEGVTNVTWLAGPFEELGPRLTQTYDLIFGGDSLHWLDWEQAMPLFRTLLTPTGVVACVSRPFATGAVKDAVQPLIRKYTFAKQWDDYALQDVWQRQFGFTPLGAEAVAADVHAKTIDEWITAWFSMSTMTRSRLGDEASAAFAREARAALAPLVREGRVAMAVENEIWWGRP